MRTYNEQHSGASRGVALILGANVCSSKRWIAAALTVGLAVGVVTIAAGAGKLVIEPPEAYDCGAKEPTKEGETFAFLLKNAGDEPLEIKRVRPFCGCTTVEPLATSTLAPGKTVELRGVQRTAGYEGPLSKGIAITTDDPEKSGQLVRVKVRLPYRDTGLRLYPPRRQGGFLVQQVGEKLRAVMWVQNCGPELTAQVTAIDLPDPWTTDVKLPATLKPDDMTQIDLWREVTPGEEPQDFDGLPFVVRTTDPEHPSLESTLRFSRPKPAPEKQAAQGQPTAGNPPPDAK